MNVEWVRVGEEMTRRSKILNTKLIINDIRHSDLGRYGCIISNGEDFVNRVINIYEKDREIRYFIHDDIDIKVLKLKIKPKMQYKNSTNKLFGGQLKLACDTGKIINQIVVLC